MSAIVALQPGALSLSARRGQSVVGSGCGRLVRQTATTAAAPRCLSARAPRATFLFCAPSCPRSSPSRSFGTLLRSGNPLPPCGPATPAGCGGGCVQRVTGRFDQWAASSERGRPGLAAMLAHGVRSWPTSTCAVCRLCCREARSWVQHKRGTCSQRRRSCAQPANQKDRKRDIETRRLNTINRRKNDGQGV